MDSLVSEKLSRKFSEIWVHCFVVIHCFLTQMSLLSMPLGNALCINYSDARPQACDSPTACGENAECVDDGEGKYHCECPEGFESVSDYECVGKLVFNIVR